MPCSRPCAPGRPSRPSHEGRGLKYPGVIANSIKLRSSLSRGTWIEINAPASLGGGKMSSLSRGTWIEIAIGSAVGVSSMCPSLSRGTWIEINGIKSRTRPCGASSLSRGTWIEMFSVLSAVKVPQRRPSHEGRGLKSSPVALLVRGRWSSLSRGTWIEISPRLHIGTPPSSSLSRGTWIEITSPALLLFSR